MRRNRSSASIVASPVLVGAVTVLVVVVAVFLAYNANNGLPFVPTHKFSVVVPDAAQLVAGNDVDVGGVRVGTVTTVRAALEHGRPVAILQLKVEDSLDPPRDTRVAIRQRSNVGLKYVELRLGHARAWIPDGGVIALSGAVPTVDLNDVVNTFDSPTRAGLAGVVSNLGVGLAGRGEAINAALAAFPTAFADLRIVARVLASRDADLDGFIRGAGSAAAAVAPVAGTLSELFDTGATTFAAIARERTALGAAIERAPDTERVASRAFTALRPLLTQATALVRDAGPGVRMLPAASHQLAGALEASAPALASTRALGGPLESVIAQTRRLARRKTTTGALQRLTEVVTSTASLLRSVNPFQIDCNAMGLWFRNVPSIASEGDAAGSWFRFVPVTQVDEVLPRSTPSPGLHLNPLPDVGQQGECESGNEAFQAGRHIGPVPGRQPAATEPTIAGTLAENLAYETKGVR